MPATNPKKFVIQKPFMDVSRKGTICKAILRNKIKEEKRKQEEEEERKRLAESQDTIEPEIEVPDLIANAEEPEKTIEVLESKLEELKKEKHKLFMLLKQVLAEEEKRKQQEEALERKRLEEQRAQQQQHQQLQDPQSMDQPKLEMSQSTYMTGHTMYSMSQHYNMEGLMPRYSMASPPHTMNTNTPPISPVMSNNSYMNSQMSQDRKNKSENTKKPAGFTSIIATLSASSTTIQSPSSPSFQNVNHSPQMSNRPYSPYDTPNTPTQSSMYNSKPSQSGSYSSSSSNYMSYQSYSSSRMSSSPSGYHNSNRQPHSSMYGNNSKQRANPYY